MQSDLPRGAACLYLFQFKVLVGKIRPLFLAVMNILPKKNPNQAAYIERTIRAGFALALLCLGVIGVISFISVTRLSKDADRTRQSEEFIAALRLLLSTTTDAETSQRGFAITGNESFLKPYNDARRLLDVDLGNLRNLAADNDWQLHQLDILAPLVAERINEITGTIELRRSQGFAAAQAAIASGRGKVLHDHIRVITAKMEASEQSLVKQAELSTRRSAAVARIVIIGGSALALVVVAFSLVSVRRDFVRRQRAEAELDRFFTLSLDFLCIASADGYFKRASPAVTDILGWSVEEFLARPFMSFVHPDDAAATLREIDKQIVAGEKVMQFENRYQHKDGSWRVLSWRSVPQPGGLMYATARDVTELKQMQEWLREANEDLERRVQERTADLLKISSDLQKEIIERNRTALALAESQALYHSLVEQMPAGVFRKDAEGRYAFVNSYFCRIRDYTPEVFLGKLPAELPPAEASMAAQACQHHAQIMETGRPLEVLEEYQRGDGQTRFFHVVKSPVLDSDGKITGSQGVLFDVTTQKRAEDQVRRLNEELERRVVDRTAQLEAANKELEAFSYSVSHDLRAPLRAVNGFAGIVLEEFGPQLNGDGRRYLERIRNGGRQMGMLIDDLLAFSRLGRQPMSSQTFDSAQLVQAALDELAPQRERPQIEINIGQLPVGRGDPALVKQVWVNLISNAIKYTRDRAPAVIEIGCEVKHDERIYFVRDNGAGFDMQYAHKLFGVFHRLHRADEFEGTGVGLAIVQRIVNRHGGRVWADAKLNHGATFYFTLPG